jgi:hypothetical protein
VGRVGIDVNMVIGSVDPRDVQRLASAGERAGLLGLWVTAEASRSTDPERPDDALIDACEAIPALVPVPVLVPPTGFPRAHSRAVELMSGGAHRVVRLCPVTHGYPLLDWVVSPIPELCARHGVALMLDFDAGPVPWGGVVDFARMFPSLPLITLGADVARDRALPAVLDHALNLLMATGSDDIEYLTATFGHHRFVWSGGSSEPTAPCRGLPEAIASGNAEALWAGSYAGAHL